MASKDNRKINSGIVLPHDPGTKTPHAVSKTWTEADDFDDLECQLTPEMVDRLTQVDVATGKAPLEGNWTGKAKKAGEGKDAKVVPAKAKPESKPDTKDK